MAHGKNVQTWMDWIEKGHPPAELSQLLAEEVVFHSPVVHAPQTGKPLVMAYLVAAGQTILNDSFTYKRVFDGGDKAVLEFETEMDGLHVNGIDMIEWNEAGRIIDFKVMVRPLKGIQIVHQQMGEALQKIRDRL